MKSVHSNSPKLKSLTGNVSPINTFTTASDPYSCSYSIFDPYTSPDSTSSEILDSTIIRYLRTRSPVAENQNYRPSIGHKKYHGSSISSSSGSLGSRGSLSRSPFSSIENLQETTLPSRSPSVFKTPVKVEDDDVLVMDGILVGSSSSSGSKSIQKKELCRSWEDSANCRYGSKCQFAHGKQELRRQIRLGRKSKLETCKTYSSSGSCFHGSKCRFLHHKTPTETSRATVSTSRTSPATPSTTRTRSSIKLDHSTSSTITVPTTYWSPADDGIEIALSSVSTKEAPSREDVNAYINNVLYGLGRRTRLPVFAAICPE